MIDIERNEVSGDPRSLKRVVRRTLLVWSDDRPVLIVSLVAFLGYAALWWSKGAMDVADSPSYRTAAEALLHGAEVIPDRVPGYPAFMIVTGATDHPSRALFLAQLGLHVASVLLVVATGRVLGVQRSLRLALAVLLLLPPLAAQTLYVSSEVVAQFAVVVSVWAFTRWVATHRVNDLIVVGVAVGAAAWIRPTFTAWFLVAALVVWATSRAPGAAHRGSPMRHAALVGGMGLAIVVLLVVSNLIRFSYPSTTPLLAWNLSTRTSSFVEEIGGDAELRELLVDERNRSLVEGDSHTGNMYIWNVRESVGPATGMSGRELDQYILQLNARLIASNPLSYAAAVTGAMGNYVLLYSPPDASFGIDPVPLLWLVIHVVLTAAFVIQGCVVAGLALLRRVPHRVLWPLVFGYSVLLYNLAVSTLFEIGSARYRAPTDPVALLLLAVGLTLWSTERASGSAQAEDRESQDVGERMATPSGTSA